MREVLEAEVDGDLFDAHITLLQQALGMLDAQPVEIVMRRGLEFLAEKPDQMVRADEDGCSRVSSASGSVRSRACNEWLTLGSGCAMLLLLVTDMMAITGTCNKQVATSYIPAAGHRHRHL
jgi:hypothetical protein